MGLIKAGTLLFAAILAGGCSTVREYRPLGPRMEQVYHSAQAGTPRRERPDERGPRGLEISEERIRAVSSMGREVFLDYEDAYAKGYRTGVRENVGLLASEFAGNNFPYYYWQAPLVQKVFMPSRIIGGVYMPAHYEYVIILPGEWREQYGYPIGNRKEHIPAASFFEGTKQEQKIFKPEGE